MTTPTLVEELADLPEAQAYVSGVYLLLTRDQRHRILAMLDDLAAKEARIATLGKALAALRAKPFEVLADPPLGPQQRSKLAKAIKTTEYKYFGDYEFSPEQADAVETLVEFARAALSHGEPVT